MALLEFDDVSVTYHSGGVDVPAVRGVTLSVDAGETLGIAGESGCGKTTLTSTVLRLQPKTARVTGEVRLDGQDLTFTPPHKRRTGMVFQDYALFPNMTVAENIEFGPMIAGVTSSRRATRVGELASASLI